MLKVQSEKEVEVSRPLAEGYQWCDSRVSDRENWEGKVNVVQWGIQKNEIRIKYYSILKGRSRIKTDRTMTKRDWKESTLRKAETLEMLGVMSRQLYRSLWSHEMLLNLQLFFTAIEWCKKLSDELSNESASQNEWEVDCVSIL